MKIVASVVIALLGVPLCSIAAEPYPARNAQYFSNGALDTSYSGKWVAVEGVVDEVRSAHAGKPLLRLRLTAPAFGDLWVATLFTDEFQTIQKGQLVRTLGYLVPADPTDPHLGALGSNHVVLGACAFSLGSKQAFYLEEAKADCSAWESGTHANDIGSAL